ncbi:MAG: DUF4173 domain-containing protein [Oscillospiraceae bacterium]|nr:DUF4173 domain-containing protein [Oscillospiraceae bacterium]
MERTEWKEHMETPELPERPDIAAGLKLKLVGYLLLTAVSVSHLILVPHAGISALVFVALQGICLFFIVPRKTPLLMLVPIAILALNAFLSANNIWRVPNLVVALVLYNVMAVWLMQNLGLGQTLPRFLQHISTHIFGALRHIGLPFRWGAETQKAHTPIIKRVCIGIAISIPLLAFLLFMLSMADEIFARTLEDFIDWASQLVELDTMIRIGIGLLVGLYLFGSLYGVFIHQKREAAEARVRRGDLMILNIVLVSVLVVYTLFVIIQFRYLFAQPDNLPYGLNFVHYARRGFFELLLLMGVNILFILIAVWLTKAQTGIWAKVTKGLCLYLCAITVVLLISSFYRMWLYGSDDGLTRLRFLVFGFLFFEAIGLLFTFVYIIRPKFNIIAVYCVVALAYYLVLNLVPMDRIIAREQIDRYFETGQGGIHYAMTLSPDAAPEVERLLASENPDTRALAERYLERMENMASTRTDWRQWNRAVERVR